MRYSIIIEQTDTGFSAYAPDVPGCVAIGTTAEEVKREPQSRLGLSTRWWVRRASV